MKSEDNLENFIKENRSLFDDKQPSDRLWEKIESKIEQDNSTSTNWLVENYWQAAAVFFFVATSVLLLLIFNSQPSDSISPSVASNEFEEVESYYANAINEKKVALVALSEASPELMMQFELDLSSLDSLYTNLKAGLNNSGDPQQMQDAMVQNLKLRIDILNMQLSILTKIKNTQNNKTHETSL